MSKYEKNLHLSKNLLDVNQDLNRDSSFIFIPSYKKKNYCITFCGDLLNILIPITIFVGVIIIVILLI